MSFNQSVITKIRSSLTLYVKELGTLDKSISQIDSKIKALEKAGIEHGSPSWKKDKNDNSFLRIVRPATNEQKREFVYVGSKPEKIAEAFSSINRYNQRTKLYKERYELSSMKLLIQGRLNNTLEKSLDAYTRKRAAELSKRCNEIEIDLTGDIEQIDIEHIRPTHDQ